MTLHAVEWVLVISYNISAHRAVYGRLTGSKYTKDYIQLYKGDFVQVLSDVFGLEEGSKDKIPITYRWPGGEVGGKIQLKSADRPHLAWETKDGAPQPWKMSLTPGLPAVETIYGNPGHNNPVAADAEFDALFDRGEGKPYLIAIKMRDEESVLHVRAYMDDPAMEFEWASTSMLPHSVKEVIDQVSGNRAGAWRRFESAGVPPTARVHQLIEDASIAVDLAEFVSGLDPTDILVLSAYLEDPGTGVFFDVDKNHDAWLSPPSALSNSLREQFLDELKKAPKPTEVSETALIVSDSEDGSEEEEEKYLKKIDEADYSFDDINTTSKSRGSAQRAFSKKVKNNYGNKCAITGIVNSKFLVGAHIVPWSIDDKIRLDPSNGICLSIFVDRAFEYGLIEIDNDLNVKVRKDKFDDDTLLSLLLTYDGVKLASPTAFAPKEEYLERRRKLNEGEK